MVLGLGSVCVCVYVCVYAVYASVYSSQWFVQWDGALPIVILPERETGRVINIHDFEVQRPFGAHEKNK